MKERAITKVRSAPILRVPQLRRLILILGFILC